MSLIRVTRAAIQAALQALVKTRNTRAAIHVTLQNTAKTRNTRAAIHILTPAFPTSAPYHYSQVID